MNYNDRLFAQKPSDRRPTCGAGDLARTFANVEQGFGKVQDSQEHRDKE